MTTFIRDAAATVKVLADEFEASEPAIILHYESRKRRMEKLIEIVRSSETYETGAFSEEDDTIEIRASGVRIIMHLTPR